MKIAVNGVELNYEVTGSGEPLILVHGEPLKLLIKNQYKK